MKLVIPRLDLVALIGKIQNIVPSKPSVPILSHVLLEAVDDQLILSATDLTLSMRAYTGAKVLEEGSIVLPARRLFQLVRELTAPSVEIHSETPETAFINAGTSHFKIQGMHQSEFPCLPDLADSVTGLLTSDSLKEMLSRTTFAAAHNDSRQALNGVCLHGAGKVVTFTTTDGKRLAKVHAEIDLPPEHTGSYIIPIRAAEEMIHILDSKEQAKIFLMTDKIALEVGPVTLISKLISGQYPDISRIIPEQTLSPVSLHREELISLLRQVSLFTSENTSSVRFTFAPGELHISAVSSEIGEGRVNMPVNYEGERLDIAFNPIYFIDILRHSKDETVNFNVSNSYNPGLITDSSTAQFVIMPMRLEAHAEKSTC